MYQFSEWVLERICPGDIHTESSIFVRESVIEYGYLFNVWIITFHVALCLTNSR